MTEEITERIQALTEAHRGVLNRLESHLGCVICRGELVDGKCPSCQHDQFEMDDDGKLRPIPPHSGSQLPLNGGEIDPFEISKAITDPGHW